MPIEKPSEKTAPVYYPAGNPTIVKYLDLTKFISILQTKKLFFCRLDKFEDKFEGTFPKLSIEQYKNWLLRLAKDSDFLFKDEDEIESFLNDRISASEKFKRMNCISCWNKSEKESYALWKIYSDIDKGIMIKSSVKNLNYAFEKTPEKIQLSEIKYIDFEKDRIPVNNLNYPIIHKQLAYNYEEELRLIHQVKFENGFHYDWEKEENSNGKNISVDIDLLIDEIIISPYASEWFYKIVENLINTYKLNKPIKYSKLKS
ncbi:MAG TPA: hypothetical protein PLP39_06310 [Flavobacterium lutivivi]|nr:hypothetical protein [Flavobacterium lutivivi]